MQVSTTYSTTKFIPKRKQIAIYRALAPGYRIGPAVIAGVRLPRVISKVQACR